jgi:hypothetical protein
VAASTGGAAASAAARQVMVVPPLAAAMQLGNAAGQSALVAQIWRLPAAPQAEAIWHPRWQHTVPPLQSADVVQTGFWPIGQVAAQVPPPPPPPQHDSPVPHWAVVVQSLLDPAGQVAPVWQVFGVRPPPPASAPSAQQELPVAQSPLPAQICVVPVGHEAWQAATPPSVSALQQTCPAVVHDAVPTQGTGARHVITPSVPPKNGVHVEPLAQSAFVVQMVGLFAGQVAMQDVMLVFPAVPASPAPPRPPPPAKQHCSPAPQPAELVHPTLAAPAGHALAEAAHEYVAAAPAAPAVTQQTCEDGQLQPPAAPSRPPPTDDDAVVEAPAEVLPDDDPLVVRELVAPGPLFVVPPPQATATAKPIATATTARAFFKFMGRPSALTTSKSPALDGSPQSIASTFLSLGSSIELTSARLPRSAS